MYVFAGIPKSINPKVDERIRNNSFVQIGFSYNVTDNAIKKWCESSEYL